MKDIVGVVERIRNKYARNDEAEGGWITVNGAHVPLGENGELQGAVGAAISSRDFGSKFAKEFKQSLEKGDKKANPAILDGMRIGDKIAIKGSSEYGGTHNFQIRRIEDDSRGERYLVNKMEHSRHGAVLALTSELRSLGRNSEGAYSVSYNDTQVDKIGNNAQTEADPFRNPDGSQSYSQYLAELEAGGDLYKEFGDEYESGDPYWQSVVEQSLGAGHNILN